MIDPDIRRMVASFRWSEFKDASPLLSRLRLRRERRDLNLRAIEASKLARLTSKEKIFFFIYAHN